MSTPSRLLVAALTLLPLIACGGEHASKHETALVTISARVATAERIELPHRVAVRGIVEAEKSAAISSRVSAMVTRVAVQTGERVRRGQVLLEIDPATANGQLSQATGALAQAQAALALAERNYARFQALAASDAASELELDMARMQLEQAKGAVEQAAGAVQAAQSVAAESTVRAPFAGLVARRMVEVGDFAAPGRPLLALESEGGRRLTLAVPESLMTRADLAVGDLVEARLDARPDLGTLSAVVVERSSAADPVSHSFEVKLALPADEVASGGTGRAWIELEPRTAIVVPAEAPLRRGGLTLVVVRTPAGLSESRVVTLGTPVAGERIEILSGLRGGESVLVGLTTLPPGGSPVEAAP